jgi:hypothetical protein
LCAKSFSLNAGRKILSWYRKDFPKSDVDFMDWIAKFLDDSHPLKQLNGNYAAIKIAFSEYNWDLNGEVEKSDEDNDKSKSK